MPRRISGHSAVNNVGNPGSVSDVGDLRKPDSISFKARLAIKERLIGTWIKTPSSIVVEVLADTPLDLLVLDAEHAPFGRMELDACVFACRALAKPCLIRVPTSQPHDLLQVLDLGCTGVLVPHVRSGEEAAAIVKAAHYGPGGRGYAGSSRAANYGTKSIPDHQTDSAAQTVVIAQIEDAEAVARTEEIASTAGLDAIFIGPVDLSVSLGEPGPSTPAVMEAIAIIAAASLAAGTPVGIFANSTAQIAQYSDMGITLFIAQSDHQFLRLGAAQLLNP